MRPPVLWRRTKVTPWESQRLSLADSEQELLAKLAGKWRNALRKSSREPFEVKIIENGHTVIGYTAGKLKKNRIRVLEGDEVLCSISPYDLRRCRITFRY